VTSSSPKHTPEFTSTGHLASPRIYGAGPRDPVRRYLERVRAFNRSVANSEEQDGFDPRTDRRGVVKTSDWSEALDGRTKLADLLQSKGWFLAGIP